MCHRIGGTGRSLGHSKRLDGEAVKGGQGGETMKKRFLEAS